MRKFLLAFAVLVAMGTLAVAQTYDQSQDATSPPSTTNGTANDSAVTQQASDNDAAAQQVEQTDLNSPNFTHQDFRGTELEKAYQREEQSGWNDPNITKSSGIDNGGGGQ
jgi:hypothetical protein